MIQTQKLSISFSGGRTSAVMTKLLLENFPEKEIEIIFANTGLEHPDTIRFVNDCDRFLFDNRVVYLEAVVNPDHGKGIRHKIVDFKNASRNGEPYYQAAKKYGLFNPTHPNCTGRLKVEVMESYLKSLGWLRGRKLNYTTAIGIRADEIDRCSAKARENKIIYPLVKWKITKKEVLNECKKWPFDLKIPEHYGNCVGCWKKSLRKLATISQEMPQAFDFWRKIETELEDYKPPPEKKRRIYRENRTVDDLFEIGAGEDFKPYTETKVGPGLFDHLDIGSACGESCEIYADRDD